MRLTNAPEITATRELVFGSTASGRTFRIEAPMRPVGRSSIRFHICTHRACVVGVRYIETGGRAICLI